jgi:thymidylate kinase
LLILFEGLDRSGKGTQVQMLAASLEVWPKRARVARALTADPRAIDVRSPLPRTRRRLGVT